MAPGPVRGRAGHLDRLKNTTCHLQSELSDCSKIQRSLISCHNKNRATCSLRSFYCQAFGAISATDDTGETGETGEILPGPPAHRAVRLRGTPKKDNGQHKQHMPLTACRKRAKCPNGWLCGSTSRYSKRSSVYLTYSCRHLYAFPVGKSHAKATSTLNTMTAISDSCVLTPG